MMHRLIVLSLAALAAWGEPVIVQARLDNQPITPVTAAYLKKAIVEAEREKAQCVVLVLDTPGGLLDSTREMVKDILASRVPVVVYVAPSGARAASAGVFITMAAHVAAMAPGTNIGAAHPVQIGAPGMPGGEKQPGEEKKGGESGGGTIMEQKAVNDTVAWVRSLAELRARNADWAVRAVTESISSPATEALKSNVVDLIAEDEADLLKKLHGREVTMRSGKVTLDTDGVRVVSREMWWGERLLASLANPTIAFLLLMFGFYGVLFELYSPGWGIPGTVGIVCLVLGFFAMSVLPIDYVGFALLLLAMGLFGAEAFVPSHGMLTVAGVICLVLGGLMLVDSPEGFQRVSLWALIPVSLATAAVATLLVGSIVRSRHQAMQSVEPLLGLTAVADGEFAGPDGAFAGRVRIHGELWRGVSDYPIAAGSAVVVTGRDGLTLSVKPEEQGKG